MFTEHDFLPAETTNIPADSQHMAATASGSSCDHTQAERPAQTSQITHKESLVKTATCLTHLKTFMMVNLLQRWLKILHEPMRSTKLLLQRFCKYKNRAWGKYVVAVEQPLWPHLPRNKTLKCPHWTGHQEWSSSYSRRRNQECLYKAAQPLVIRTAHNVCIAMNGTECQLKVG